jgi:methyltransferase (TIGR00027 family)
MSRIENVSDTARWVAVYRAMETARPDAIFRDPYAERLAGPRGVEIVDNMKRGRAMAWAMIVRTAVFDEIILDRVRHHGVGRVVNLAAGLDARAWRLPLPPTLRWIDVDLPAMTEYKREAMRGERPACAYEAVAADLADAAERRALFERLRAEPATTLVVAEGLLVYLAPEDVAALARDLHDVLGARWWLLDLASADLLKMMQRMWGRSVTSGNAPFRFGPAEGTAFFAPSGWREIVFRSTMEDARRLRREMRLMWFWRLLGRLQPARRRARYERFSGVVLLEADPPVS